MQSPCECCVHKIEHKEGHRIFHTCGDEEKKKGFVTDDFTHRHKCSNHTPHEKCLTCKKYKAPYCDNVYVHCEYVPINTEVHNDI